MAVQRQLHDGPTAARAALFHTIRRSLGPLASTVAARQLALLGRRATQPSLEHGRSRRGHDVLSAGHRLELHFFRSRFAYPRTFSPLPSFARRGCLCAMRSYPKRVRSESSQRLAAAPARPRRACATALPLSPYLLSLVRVSPLSCLDLSALFLRYVPSTRPRGDQEPGTTRTDA